MVEFVDELVDGSRGAALPYMRHDLSLTYAQVGLLVAVPLLVGSLIELPMGMLAGYGARRRRVVTFGGLAFVSALLAVAAASSFVTLLVAFIAFFPASGAFVTLTQAELMDAAALTDPPGMRGAVGDSRERYMAAWTLAGSIGALTGPPLVVVALASGGSWRTAFLLAAVGAAVALAGTRRVPVMAARRATDTPERSTMGQLLSALMSGTVVRWLVLLEVSDLLVDVLTGFLALYFVDVAHTTPAWAALAIALRLACGLAGEAVLIPLLGRLPGRAVLLISSVIAALAYPAFLLAPGLPLKLGLLGVLSTATAMWYPLLTAQLYGTLEGHSGVAVTLTSGAALVGSLGPLVLGVAAQQLGLLPALAGLTVVPVAFLAALLFSRKA